MRKNFTLRLKKISVCRMSMISLALLNVLMVTDSVLKTVGRGESVPPTLVLASAFQLLYAMDALFFEEYYFQSHDAMNSG
jgi:hypothetical protein